MSDDQIANDEGGFEPNPIAGDSMPADHEDAGAIAEREQTDALANDVDAQAASAGEQKEPETALDAVAKVLGKKEDPQAKTGDESPDDAKDGADADDSQAKAGDEIPDLYRIPEGMKGEHRAAFKKLSDHAQEVNEAYQENSAILTGFNKVLEDCGADAGQFSASMQFVAAVNQGDFDSALAWLDAERAAIAQHLGKPVDGVDLLDGFDDLKAQVDDEEITEEAAREIATARRANARARQQADQAEKDRQAQAQQTETTQAFQTKKSAALADVGKWLGELKGKDIDFVAKERMLNQYVNDPTTAEILQNLDPALWSKHLRKVYDSFNSPTGAAPAPGDVTPLRPNASRGVQKEASSELEALQMALGKR